MKAHVALTDTAQSGPVAATMDHAEAASGESVFGQTSAQGSALQTRISQSPRMLAQRRAMQAALGPASQAESVETRPIQTGLPNQLKAGIESLSGIDMSAVRVHRNSDKPAQLNALAYAQGNNIHLGRGQEQHLPHEAWHVVQQRQGKVKATRQMVGVGLNDDVGLESEADLMGEKAEGGSAQLMTGGQARRPDPETGANIPVKPPREKPTTPDAGNGAASGKPVQRVERKAQVTWAITHLVRVQDEGQGESLFGKDDDWQSGEVSPDDFGQLSHNQLIIVDDEAVFMSRRGVNQENPLRRRHNSETDELNQKWLRVLAIWVDDGFKPAPRDAYVRAETIKLIGVEKPPPKDIILREHSSQDEIAVSSDLNGFHEAWKLAAAKRRRSTGQVQIEFGESIPNDGDDITSGWNWDKYDEGENVSGDMKEPAEREAFEGVTTQHIFSAKYHSDQESEPIAYMVLEVRDDGDGPYMYIRWLIAHPEKGGGGSVLVKSAIERLGAQEECAELRVDSAFSAVGWYESMGFQKVSPKKSAVKKGVGYADTKLVIRKFKSEENVQEGAAEQVQMAKQRKFELEDSSSS